MSVAVAILLAGIGTYLSRAVFILVLAQRRFPPLALRALEYVAPAVMGALIVSMLTTPRGDVQIGVPEITGLVCAAIAIRATRSHVYALFAGMGSFWITAYLL